MKLEVRKTGLLAKNKEAKTVTIGKERPPCPACGTACNPKWMRCEVCGAALSAQAGIAAAPSRLSDEELGAKLRKHRMKSILSIVGAVTLFAMFVILGAMDVWLAAAPALIAAIVLAIYAAVQQSGKKKLVSVNVTRDALAEVFDLTDYTPGDRIAPEQIRAADLVDGWNESLGSDLVQGKYRGVPFVLSDIKLDRVTRSRNSDGNASEHRETIFQGQWLICDIAKQIDAPLRIRERAVLGKKLCADRGKSDVETENDAFNKKFRILTGDPHSAFYILTPHFMEYILAADVVAKGQSFLCFAGRQVHFAVNNKHDSFEIGRKKIDVPVIRARIQAEVKYVTEIIDELLQNEYLFSGE